MATARKSAPKADPEIIDIVSTAALPEGADNYEIGTVVGHVLTAALNEGVDHTLLEDIVVRISDGVVYVVGKAPVR